jgi:hypothetical protein
MPDNFYFTFPRSDKAKVAHRHVARSRPLLDCVVLKFVRKSEKRLAPI